MAALDPITGLLGKKAAAHLLRRLTFGPNKAMIDAFASKTIDQAIADLFAPVVAPIETDAELSWLVAKPLPNEKIDEGTKITQLKSWWINRMLKSGANAQEKLTFFLHTHFTCIFSVFEKHTPVYYQNKLLRKYSLGNIKTLATAINLDNAMLMLLSGSSNIKKSPNENYARELLELYTIGKFFQNPETLGTNDYGNYTEQDVKSAAKVLTGFTTDLTYATIDAVTGIPRGKLRTTPAGLSSEHDISTKTFSTRFGNQQIAPSALSGSSATELVVIEEIDQLMNMIFNQTETAKNICRKIYRYFVYYNTPYQLKNPANPEEGYKLNDYVENNIITPLAVLLKSNNYELKPVYEKLFKSEHFFFKDSPSTATEDRTNGAIIKSPLDLSLGMMRLFNVNVANQDSLKFFAESLAKQGLNLYEPLDVAGYEAYHAFPFFHRSWISANYLAERYLFPKKLLNGKDGMEDIGFRLDIVDFVRNSGIFTGDIGDTNSFVLQAIDLTLPEPITEERKDYFKGKLTDNQPDLEWTAEWSDYLTSGDDKVVRELLDSFFWHLMKSPEYQLM
ncbi:MAG: DUF1800 family protein [Cytophagales bacterium]|nr:MAG: DUF1800 family protein [Cytophagales bacterium]